MGTASSVLKCPKGYDPVKFKKICSLFDKLDKDSNMGVSSDELTHIAKLHVKNCIQSLRRKLDAEQTTLQTTLNAIDFQCKKDIDTRKEAAHAEKESTKRQSQAISASIQNKINMYSNLDEDQKENVFMKVLTPTGSEHIDFWTFFEYMKTRTHDIDNIQET